MVSNHPLGQDTSTAIETHAKQIWRTTDKARTYASIWRLIASGSTIAQACDDCGVNVGSYSVAIQKNDNLMAHHLRALRAKSACVVDALLDTAIGNATETRTTTGTKGVEVVVTKLAPNVTAQKYVLNNLQPQQWSEKVDMQHSGEIKYEPLSITVKPVTIDVDATDAEVTDKKGTVIDL